MNRLRIAIGLVSIAAGIVAATLPTEAHKPITSPFTFNEDVLPIVRTHCAECHAPQGVAPMSLLTHAEAVPWGESIRIELMAGHMPPWAVEGAASRFRNLQPFSARDLNVLLTWASGGTPAGGADIPTAAPYQPQWTLGQPDEIIPLRDVSVAGDVVSHVEEFSVPAPARLLRAIDLLPGTPAIVRQATIAVRTPSDGDSSGLAPERLVSLWVPGDHPVSTDPGMGFDVPPGSELVVRISYRKTWQYERQAMADRSAVGLYFAEPSSRPLQVVRTSTPPSGTSTVSEAAASVVSSATTVAEDVSAVAVYADPDTTGAHITVVAARPDGSREELIAFRSRPDWPRRYWFREPIRLPKGTRIDVTADFDAARLLPPAAPAPVSSAAPPSATVVLNVVQEK